MSTLYEILYLKEKLIIAPINRLTNTHQANDITDIDLKTVNRMSPPALTLK